MCSRAGGRQPTSLDVVDMIMTVAKHDGEVISAKRSLKYILEDPIPPLLRRQLFTTLYK